VCSPEWEFQSRTDILTCFIPLASTTFLQFHYHRKLSTLSYSQPITPKFRSSNLYTLRIYISVKAHPSYCFEYAKVDDIHTSRCVRDSKVSDYRGTPIKFGTNPPQSGGTESLQLRLSRTLSSDPKNRCARKKEHSFLEVSTPANNAKMYFLLSTYTLSWLRRDKK
jgi:hypothetical protein